MKKQIDWGCFWLGFKHGLSLPLMILVYGHKRTFEIFDEELHDYIELRKKYKY